MRTDVHALSMFVRRCAAEDAQRYREAAERRDTWVRTSPTGLINGGENALRDLAVKMSGLAEHPPMGPGLCERCTVHYDWPVTWPCYWVRLNLSSWQDRPGWWPGWSNKGTPHGHPNAHIHLHRAAGLLESSLFDPRLREPVWEGRPPRAGCRWIAHVDGRARACECGTHAGQRADVWEPIGGRSRLSVPDRLPNGGYLGEEDRRYRAGRTTARWFM